MTPYVIIVTGQRDWKDKETIYRVLDEELNTWLASCPIGTSAQERGVKAFVLRHGVSLGADSIANDWGKERGVTIERFPAEWKVPGSSEPDYSAGPRRNAKMAAALPRANKCVAFWDGKVTMRRGRPVSGTRDMIMTALQHYIPVRAEPPKQP